MILSERGVGVGEGSRRTLVKDELVGARQNVDGRVAVDKLDDAAALYQKALQALAAAEKSPNPDVLTLLGPRIEPDAVHYQAGLLEYSRQRYDAAINHFDASLKISPKNSYAIFLRARSKEALHLNQPALADYALAAQTARANNDTSWSVGQAHYQRGLLFYESKDFSRAEAATAISRNSFSKSSGNISSRCESGAKKFSASPITSMKRSNAAQPVRMKRPTG